MRKVTVSPYSEQWTVMFAEEAEVLRGIFGPEIVAIHHIGSTSVPGLAAKPIIDILPVVRDIGRIDAYNAKMAAAGYEPKGENGIPGRRYFQKGGDQRTHHVHVFQAGSPEIERHLAFRDYLKAHPDEAKAYGELKARLAERYPYDIESYIKGKEQRVREIERRAVRWYREVFRGK
jgi:GrpB-like predicted nucleotidyltransferase (UPF0157 family)